MRLTCPSCGAVHSADAWANDADARQCLRIVAELPGGVGRRVLPYLALFRPAGGRGLTWGRALKLLHELSRLVQEPHVQWDKQPARPNSAAAWAQALEQIVQRPPARLPLTSHGYLRRIAYDNANQEDRAAEVRHNQAERTGNARRPAEQQPNWKPGPEDFAAVRKAIKGIGKEI